MATGISFLPDIQATSINSITATAGGAKASPDTNNYNATSPLLPYIKCQSYIAIFEDAYEQLSVLSDIAPKENNQISGKKTLENEIAQILKEQRNLELRYNEILQEQEALRTQQSMNGKKGNESQQQQQQRQATKKKFSSHTQNISKINTERAHLLTLLGRSLQELKECRFDTWLAAVEEEYQKKDLLQNTINREMESTIQLKSLQEQLQREKQVLGEETLERDQIVQQLKDTIQEVKLLTASEQKYLKKEIRAHENSVRIQCSRKESQLEKEKDLLQQQNAIELQAHESIMEFLAYQRELLEQKIQDWMTKYEEDTEKKVQEMEALKQKRAAELEQYEELVGRHQELEKQVEEDKRQRQLAEEARKLEELRNQKATKIQRWWRKKREKLKAGKGKKKGKGSGKKGSGKKGSGKK